MLDKAVKLPSLKDKIEQQAGGRPTNEKLEKLVKELNKEAETAAEKPEETKKVVISKAKNKQK